MGGRSPLIITFAGQLPSLMQKTIYFRFLFAIAASLGYMASTKAQPGPPLSSYNFQLEGNVHYGFFAQHHLEMERFNSHFPAYELLFQRATFGKDMWEALYSYPFIGIGAWYSPLGGFEEVGESYALFPFINFPLNEEIQHSLNFRVGLGLAYLTNKFEPRKNYRNFAIGSHMNVIVSLHFNYRYRLTDFITLTASAGLTHFSNGSMKTPNIGINIPSFSVGLSSFLSKPNPYLDRKLLPELYLFEFDGKRWFSIEPTLAVGYKDMTQQLGESFMVYHMSVNIMKPISLKGKFGLGIDASFDASHPAELKRKNIDYESNWQIVKPGITVIYEMVMSQTSFVFQLGSHLGGLENSRGNIYQKIGLKRYFNESLYGSITLTAHLGRADYIGFGIGYRFDFKYY